MKQRDCQQPKSSGNSKGLPEIGHCLGSGLQNWHRLWLLTFKGVKETHSRDRNPTTEPIVSNFGQILTLLCHGVCRGGSWTSVTVPTRNLHSDASVASCRMRDYACNYAVVNLHYFFRILCARA